MTNPTARLPQEMKPRDILANPPPSSAGNTDLPLFQTLGELQHRHGASPAAKDRLYLWGGGLLVGSIVFGILYASILFLE